jgi:hypothetical protein
MGGRGSGRHFSHNCATVSDCLQLDVRRWQRDGLLVAESPKFGHALVTIIRKSHVYNHCVGRGVDDRDGVGVEIGHVDSGSIRRDGRND